MKTFKIQNRVFLAAVVIAFSQKVSAANSLLFDILHPDYAVFLVVGVLMLFAFILVKVLKRNEQKSERMKSMRRYNRHRSVKQY